MGFENGKLEDECTTLNWSGMSAGPWRGVASLRNLCSGSSWVTPNPVILSKDEGTQRLRARRKPCPERSRRNPDNASSTIPIYRYKVFSPNCMGWDFPRSRRPLPWLGVCSGSGDSPWGELPESAWSFRWPRDLSTRPQSLRSFVLARDDKLGAFSNQTAQLHEICSLVCQEL